MFIEYPRRAESTCGYCKYKEDEISRYKSGTCKVKAKTSLSEDLINLLASSKLQTPGYHSATPTRSGQACCCQENRFERRDLGILLSWVCSKGKEGRKRKSRRILGQTCLGGPPHIPFRCLLRLHLFKRQRPSVSTLLKWKSLSSVWGTVSIRLFR